MPIVLKHGSKYRTCICDTCSAELAYMEDEISTMSACTPIRRKDYEEAQLQLADKDASTEVVYFYCYIRCPECKSIVYTSHRILTGEEAEMHKRCGFMV